MFYCGMMGTGVSIGHIFPEKSCESALEIKLNGEKSVNYYEIKCNTNDEFSLPADLFN